MKLSVLDYGIMDRSQTATQALKVTLETAQLADQLGFHRFWLAEHHQVPALALSSPELIMMYLLGQTQRIQIGTGGIMLPHYPTYKIAEWAKTFTALYPGRVNLGIGNNPGTLAVRQTMGTQGLGRSHYQAQVKQLVDFLYGHPEYPLQPEVEVTDPLWLLSAGHETARLAGELGQAYCYGLFLADGSQPLADARHCLDTYRQACQQAGQQAHAMLATFLVMGEDEGTLANQLAASDVWQLGKLDYAEFQTFPDQQDLAPYVLTAEDREQIRLNRQKMVYGTPDQVKDQLDQLALDLALEEILVIPLMPGARQRQDCLRALAQAYQLIK